MNTIETGYKISGKTWISEAWNAGELTRKAILAELNDQAKEAGVFKETEEETRDRLREELAADGQADSEEELEERVESEMAAMAAEDDAWTNVVDALQELHDNWTDDVDDEDQFDRVCAAHYALDDYC